MPPSWISWRACWNTRPGPYYYNLITFCLEGTPVWSSFCSFSTTNGLFVTPLPLLWSFCRLSFFTFKHVCGFQFCTVFNYTVSLWCFQAFLSFHCLCCIPLYISMNLILCFTCLSTDNWICLWFFNSFTSVSHLLYFYNIVVYS